LFIGPKVSIQDKEGKKSYRKVVKKDLEGAVRPKPNSKILGMRLKLTVYNLAGDSSKKGFIRKALRKFGEPPVLASTLDLERNEKIMVNLLENRGFFFPRLESYTKTKKRKTTAYFDVWTGPQYKINKVEFPIDSSQISKDIAAEKEK